MLHGIDHIAIAVPSIEEALPTWTALLGFELHGFEVVEEQGVRVAILTKGQDRVELVQPIVATSPVAKFLEKNGPGLHHVCLLVEGLSGMLERLKAAGVRLIDEVPKVGANERNIAFVHPKAVGGVLVELSERRAPEESDEPDGARW